jgi:hypothetical protein
VCNHLCDLPEEFSETDSEIAGIWMTDLETREVIDGTTAHYTLETESEGLDEPMRVNPALLRECSDAVAYVDAIYYLTEDDVVETCQEIVLRTTPRSSTSSVATTPSDSSTRTKLSRAVSRRSGTIVRRSHRSYPSAK